MAIGPFCDRPHLREKSKVHSSMTHASPPCANIMAFKNSGQPTATSAASPPSRPAIPCFNNLKKQLAARLKNLSAFSHQKSLDGTKKVPDTYSRFTKMAGNGGLALWRGRAVQPGPGKRRALCERSEFARRRGRRTAQGIRRASPRPTWFWSLLPKQKWLGGLAETRHYQTPKSKYGTG